MHFHVLAVGGIGMSGIARLLMQQGHTVSGSDLVRSYIVKDLETEGLEFCNLSDIVGKKKVDAVVVSSAIKESDPELIMATSLGIKCLHRAEMLKEIVKDRRIIGITGAHGKTTSTALLAWILKKLGYDPLFYVGGIVKGFDLNAYFGKGDFAILELDESDGSFSLFEPEVMFITNLELEHVDFYHNEQGLIKYFSEYMARSLNTKFVIGFKSKITKSHLFYDKLISLDEEARFVPVDYEINSDFSMQLKLFDKSQKKSFTARVPLIGEHNFYNIVGVLNVCNLIGIDVKRALGTLVDFPNVSRRMDIYALSPVTIIHDYAHHPEEITKTLLALRSVIKKRRLLVVFEPHRYTRFLSFWDGFKSALELADLIFSTPVYSAGENHIEGINNVVFCEQMGKKAIALSDYETDAILKHIKKNDCIIFLGAGKIINLAKKFAHECTTNTT